LFQTIAHIGKGIHAPLEQYTRPKPHGMTAYNHLIQQNKPMFQKQGEKWNPLEFVFMSGDLTPAAIGTATFDATNFTAVVTWDGTGGDATDKAFILIYDDESKRTASAVEVARDAGTATIDVKSFANVSAYNEIYAYLAFYRINADGSGGNSNTSVLKAIKA
jgi:hypothetical protein